MSRFRSGRTGRSAATRQSKSRGRFLMADMIDVTARPALTSGSPHHPLAAALDVSAYDRIDLVSLMASAPAPRSCRPPHAHLGHRWRRGRVPPCRSHRVRVATARHARADPVASPTARPTTLTSSEASSTAPSRSPRHARLPPRRGPRASPDMPACLLDEALGHPPGRSSPRRRRPRACSGCLPRPVARTPMLPLCHRTLAAVRWPRVRLAGSHRNVTQSGHDDRARLTRP